MYKAAYHKAKVKNQAVAGQDRFGAAHGALRQAPQKNSPDNDPSRLASYLDKYFDTLAASVTTKKACWKN